VPWASTLAVLVPQSEHAHGQVQPIFVSSFVWSIQEVCCAQGVTRHALAKEKEHPSYTRTFLDSTAWPPGQGGTQENTACANTIPTQQLRACPFGCDACLHTATHNCTGTPNHTTPWHGELYGPSPLRPRPLPPATPPFPPFHRTRPPAPDDATTVTALHLPRRR